MIDSMNGVTLRLAGRDNEDDFESTVFAIPEPATKRNKLNLRSVLSKLGWGLLAHSHCREMDNLDFFRRHNQTPVFHTCKLCSP